MEIRKAREITGRIWCDEEMKNIEMDVEIAEKIAMLLSGIDDKDKNEQL